MNDLFTRVKKRLENGMISDSLVEDYIQVVQDRLCLRLGEEALPQLFESVCVDAAVKMCRRTYYEGISSEGAAGISTSFVEDVLSEYNTEIESWKESRANKEGSGRRVMFL